MAKRRASGEGSVYYYKPRECWRGMYTAPDGRRRSVYGKTQKEAVAKLRQAISNATLGLEPEDARRTVRGWLGQWLDDIRTEVRPTTWKGYESHVRFHLIPAIGRVRLTAVTPAMIKRVITDAGKAGLSPTSQNRLRGTMRRAFNDALRLGLVSRNPVSATRQVKQERYQAVWLTQDQARALLAGTDGHDHAMYATAPRDRPPARRAPGAQVA